MTNKGMIDPDTGRFVNQITRRQMNNGARRRNAKRSAKEAEYEANWSLAAEDLRRKSTVQEKVAVETNNQLIYAGMDTSRERRKSGVSLPPRHIRRRPLQDAWKKRN